MRKTAAEPGFDAGIRFFKTVDEYDSNRDALWKNPGILRNLGDDAFTDIGESVDWALEELNEGRSKAKWRFSL